MHGRVSTSNDNFTLLLLHAESQVAQQAGGRASSGGVAEEWSGAQHCHPDVHHDVAWTFLDLRYPSMLLSGIFGMVMTCTSRGRYLGQPSTWRKLLLGFYYLE